MKVVWYLGEDGKLEECTELAYNLKEVIRVIPRLTAQMEREVGSPDYYHIPEDFFDYNWEDESSVEDEELGPSLSPSTTKNRKN